MRGTPASGKTTLSLLLRDYYLENNRNVFLVRYWESLEHFSDNDPWNQFALLLHRRYPEHGSADFFAPKSVIIVDEAQASYSDIPFWNTIIKERRSGDGADIRLCLFCSYGSPLTGVDVDRVLFTPVTFGPPQRITLNSQHEKSSPQIGLFFTKDEFDDVVSRLAIFNYQENFTLDEEARSYLFALTHGHPGAVKSMVSFVFDVRAILHP